MYDIAKRTKIESITVEDLIEELKKLPEKAQVLFCGDNRGYIHVEKDDSVVSIDREDLDGDYIEDDETSWEEYWANR